MNDDDLQILESYLDGEMSPVQSEMLWRRLSSESDLSTELEKLRAEHAARQGVWVSLEPAEHSVAQLEYSIVRGARRQEILSTVSRGFGILTTAAACILMGFTIGWLGRDRYTPGTNVGVGDNGSGSNVSIVSHDPSINTPYVVYIRDGSGHVAQQNFSSEAEAESFARDVENAQATRRDVSQPMVVPTDVKF
jgi:hypothetical protein